MLTRQPTYMQMLYREDTMSDASTLIAHFYKHLPNIYYFFNQSGLLKVLIKSAQKVLKQVLIKKVLK